MDTKEKKSQKTVLIMLAIVVLIGAFFILKPKPSGPATLDDVFADVLDGKVDESLGYVYNGFAFANVFDTWFTRVQRGDKLVEIPLHYGPREVAHIPIVGSLNQTFQQRNIFITFDPNSTQMRYIALASAELSLNIAKGLEAVPIASCTSNETACHNRPIVTCEDNVPVIYIKKAETEQVMLEGNCIRIEGNEWGIVEATDRLLLTLYGIMEKVAAEI